MEEGRCEIAEVAALAVELDDARADDGVLEEAVGCTVEVMTSPVLMPLGPRMSGTIT